ncbi:uncharacterized protein DUF3196 [Breznakia blatticola]|uniref:Uncharacterized protein DUF3196 n=1 Tax=Breznakia blatticola TaxID=1754012 RepID=A0A4R7ZB93_9FIRM|nr:DUF3196 family protein [Breznakia blatticola]TDW14777.1 uncharacterized protein DUF3196 [Breznakia blatticola]
MDYYDRLLEDVKALIKDEKFIEARQLLDVELNMPYVPLQYEQEYQSLFTYCNQQLAGNAKSKTYDQEDIEALLFGSVDQASVACEILATSNVRQHLEMIEKYLSDKPNVLIRTLLIEILIDQNIHEEIKLDYDGLHVEFIAAYVEPIAERESTEVMVKILSDDFENDNPTFYKMCIDCLVKELYFRLPFSVVEEESRYLTTAITAYVYESLGDKDQFDAYIKEKDLAKYVGYDLKLKEYRV